MSKMTYRVVKQNGILWNNRYGLSEALQVNPTNVVAAECDATRIGFVKPIQQSDQRGLSRSGPAHDRDPFSRRNCKSQSVQDALAFDVLEANVVEGDLGLRGGQG